MKVKCCYSDLHDFEEGLVYDATEVPYESFLIATYDNLLCEYYAEMTFTGTLRVDGHETRFIPV